jgi:hypothetical protein
MSAQGVVWRNERRRPSRQGVRVFRLPSRDAPSFVMIDLARLIHWPDPPITYIGLQFTGPGQIALAGSPVFCIRP